MFALPSLQIGHNFHGAKWLLHSVAVRSISEVCRNKDVSNDEYFQMDGNRLWC